MTAPVLIGLGGKLRAGKDEVAAHLERQHGFVRMGMSDPLNDAMLALDPLVPINAQEDQHGLSQTGLFARYSTIVRQSGYVEAKKNPEVRRLLQALGTEVGRNMIGENTWSDVAGRRIEELLKAGRSVALTGTRFPNELALVHQFAGRTVWVDRPSLNSDSPAGGHASENSVSAADFDVVIRNDGTLEDLYAAVDEVMRRHF